MAEYANDIIEQTDTLDSAGQAAMLRTIKRALLPAS
jgi:hypothetical protein